MKLLLCRSCGDVFSLSPTTKKCYCGQAKGKYKKDGLNATFSGDCVPLCFDNASLINATIEQLKADTLSPEKFYGARFEAWVCPKNSTTFVKKEVRQC